MISLSQNIADSVCPTRAFRLPRGNPAIMSGEKRKNKQKATPKVAKAKKMLTLKQARFAAALMKAHTKRGRNHRWLLPKEHLPIRESGLQCDPDQGPRSHAAGRTTAPSDHRKICSSTASRQRGRTRPAQRPIHRFRGARGQRVRPGAVEKAFRLLGAHPPEDPVLAAKSTVDVIICDMQQPNYDEDPIDVGPGPLPEKKELVVAGPAEEERPESEGLRHIPCTFGNPERWRQCRCG